MRRPAKDGDLRRHADTGENPAKGQFFYRKPVGRLSCSPPTIPDTFQSALRCRLHRVHGAATATSACGAV